MKKSCAWFLDENRMRTVTSYWLKFACRERKKLFMICWFQFLFLFFCLFWFGLVFNLPSSAWDSKATQMERYCWTYQNHLSSLTLKARQKMLQNKISSLSGPCSCQECPMTALWEVTAFQMVRIPWSLLIKRKWFSTQSKQIPTTHLKGLGFRCEWRFGMEF